MTPNRLISRAELARRVTTHRSFVYAECDNETGALRPAMVGTKVDLNHPDAAHFCAKYGYVEPDVMAIVKSVKKEWRTAAPSNAVLPPDQFGDDPDSAEDYLDMPLREIIARYGTQPQFKELMQATKSIVAMRGLEDDQARKRGEYIHRVHAERLIAHIDGLHKMLLSDAVSNMANKAMVMTRAGDDKPAVENALRNTVSRIIKAAKSQAERMLRNA